MTWSLVLYVDAGGVQGDVEFGTVCGRRRGTG